MPAKTIKIWFKTFIPQDVAGSVTVPGAGDQTMLPTGPIDRCFLTDGRDFSDDVDAEARMHAEIEIDLTTKVMLKQLHKCYATTEVDCQTGEVKCVDYGDTSHMAWKNYKVTAEDVITVDLVGSSHNPCMKIAGVDVSPNLDYNGTLTVMPLDADAGVSVAFNGSIETYPAFEMYASIDDGAAQVVFREPVMPGATVLNLTGAPGRKIAHQVNLRA